jgi:hypothetical protein
MTIDVPAARQKSRRRTTVTRDEGRHAVRPSISHEAAAAEARARDEALRYDRESGWVGWILFAGVMMILLGAFNAIEGFVALLNGNWLASNSDLPVRVDYAAWGWTWLIFGAIEATAGFGVLRGATWARVVGVVFAALNAIGQLLFIPAYPFWAMTVIGVDIIVIWALTVHGGDVRG